MSKRITKEYAVRNGVSFADALDMDKEPAIALRDYLRDETTAEDFGGADGEYVRRMTIRNLEDAIAVFERRDAKPREYDLSYIIKANGHQYLHVETVAAGNLKDAKTILSNDVFRRSGRNAFTITNGGFPKGWNWEYICDSLGTTMSRINERAQEVDGFCIR